MIDIDVDSGRPRHQQLADHLRARIVSGELAPGVQLPSEMYLAQEIGLHRTTVRQAVAILRREGLVETRHPYGTFVRDAPAEVGVDLAVGAVVRTRMPTPRERRCLGVGEGVPVFAVDHGGETTLYPADRVVLRTGAGRPV